MVGMFTWIDAQVLKYVLDVLTHRETKATATAGWSGQRAKVHGVIVVVEHEVLKLVTVDNDG